MMPSASMVPGQSSPQQSQIPGTSASTPIFTPSQLSSLKYQIYTYKLLSRNERVPPHLLQAVLSPSAQGSMVANNVPSPMSGVRLDTPAQPNFPSSSGSPVVPGSAQSVSKMVPQANTATPQPKTVQYNAYACPYNLLKKPISTYTHASRQQRLLIPSIIPQGIDPQGMLSERERRIKTRMFHRLTELESELGSEGDKIVLENNIAGVNGSRERIRTIIEFKALRLYEKQQAMRGELAHGVAKSVVVATPADRLAYKPIRSLSLKDARAVDAVHRHNMLNAQGVWRNKQSKLGNAVIQIHRHIEKEEQKRAEKISKERIRALKMDDEDAYLKLIDETRDTRITLLLRQTGSFLESLTRAVTDQQNDASNGTHFAIADDEDDTDVADSKLDYYKVTHRIKENVSQPNILVGGTLKEYQIKGLQWMVSLYNNHLNGILADEMGLGKTIQTISLITYLIERKKQNGPFLIIVPLSTLTNWTLEFDKWAPTVAKIVYNGPPLVRRNLQMEIRQRRFQVLLTTFDYIIKDRPVLSNIDWLHMIVDEGHRMKNINSKLTLALRQYYRTRYRLILTGTPLQNNLPELWALLNFVLPKIFKSVKSFEEWFNTPFSNQGVQDKIELNEEEQLLVIKRLHKVLRPFLLRRLKKDVESELPDKVERVIKCKLSALQLKLYTHMKKRGGIYTTSGAEKGRTSVKGLNNTIMQLRKICNHPFIFNEVEADINPSRMSNELLYRVSGKFELLDRMLPKLRQTGHRVLIFFQMTQIMSIMEDFLNYRGFAYLRLDGSTKAEDRSHLLQLFNSPESPYFVFLLSTRAGGLGLNLQSADTVIIFDSDWNPHQDLQAQDRAHRIGQTKEVRIFRLITTNSVEENILARANYKLEIDGKVIQAGKFDNRSTDEDREAFLRSLLEDKNDEESAIENEEDVDDEELNEMLKRSDQEIIVFKRLDNERIRLETEMHRRMGGRTKKPERLIQEDELPEVYRRDVDDDEDTPLNEYGRGQRVREAVRYDDGLTEDQWINALEDDDTEMNSLMSKKDGNRRKRMEGPDLTDMERLDEMRRKRGRPRKTGQEAKRKRNKNDEGLSGPDSVPPHIRQQMSTIFMKCYQAVEDAKEIYEDGSYRQRADLFMDLVSKRDYPIYYTMIKHPIAMKMIKKRIHSPHYKSIAHFRSEFHLMFENARTFNEEGSVVYEDANEMQRILDGKLNELCPGDMLPYVTPESDMTPVPLSGNGPYSYSNGINNVDLPHWSTTPGGQIPLQMPSQLSHGAGYDVEQHRQRTDRLVEDDDDEDEDEEEDYEDDEYDE